MPVAQPSVLFIALGVTAAYDEMHDDLIRKIKEKAEFFGEVHISSLAILDLQMDYDVVLVNCEAIVLPKYKQVWNPILEFVRRGGTAICLGDFGKVYENISDDCSPDDPFNELPNPFAQAGLGWKFDEQHHAVVYLNREYIPLSAERLGALPDYYITNAVFLRNVDYKDAWYRSTEMDISILPVVEADDVNSRVNPFTFSVVQANVGRGKLGYVGEVGHGTPDEVIMAMAGFTD
jgi:hypothetical protein